jgi:hypothetical protein
MGATGTVEEGIVEKGMVKRVLQHPVRDESAKRAALTQAYAWGQGA